MMSWYANDKENLWRDLPYHCQMSQCSTCKYKICEEYYGQRTEKETEG